MQIPFQWQQIIVCDDEHDNGHQMNQSKCDSEDPCERMHCSTEECCFWHHKWCCGKLKARNQIDKQTNAKQALQAFDLHCAWWQNACFGKHKGTCWVIVWHECAMVLGSDQSGQPLAAMPSESILAVAHLSTLHSTWWTTVAIALTAEVHFCQVFLGSILHCHFVLKWNILFMHLISFPVAFLFLPHEKHLDNPINALWLADHKSHFCLLFSICLHFVSILCLSTLPFLFHFRF